MIEFYSARFDNFKCDQFTNDFRLAILDYKSSISIMLQSLVDCL
jgi:hypothetical protein